jgi:ribosome-associated protein
VGSSIHVAPGVEIPAEEIAVEYSRASGPGGQHVNRTSTKVTLRFDVRASPSIPEVDRGRILAKLEPRLTKNGEILVSCDTRRERGRNFLEAWERLGEILRAAYKRERPRKKTAPSRGAKERRLKDKRHAAEKKQGRGRPDD